jgi:anti-sigma-K factor RskA
MSDIHALSGAYAIDALDDIERARFERHLAGCADCTAEVASLREAAALLPETTVARPPAALRDRVLADIDTVRPLPPVVTTTSTPAPADRRPRRRRVVALVAAAAALVAIGAVGATVWHPWSDDSSQSPTVTADDILGAEDAESWTETLTDGSSVEVTRSASLNGAVVETHDLAPAGEDQVYQLWLQHDDEMVSAGLMPAGPDNTVVLRGDPATADGFGITLEPAGGSKEPTLPPVALIPFEQA